MRGVLALAFVCLAATAHAQKPLGLFDPGDNPPAWASFGTISDTVSDERFRDAANLSRARGFKWLLGLGYWNDPTVPIGPWAATVRARLTATGLLPHVVALSVGEEWYEQWMGGAFASYGLTADNPAGLPIIHYWLGLQQQAATAALGVPSVWITTSTGYPVPAHTWAVALNPYIPTGGSFETHVAPILALAEQNTSLPLVLIPQWFDAPGYASPHEASAAQYAWWFARPRWIALLGFTWRDRPSLNMRGLESLPEIRQSVEQALGVK